MKVLVEPETPGQFGGSTPLTAEITAAVLRDHPALRRGLESFGKQLAKQMAGGKFRDSGRVVIGVELHHIEFSLVTGPPKEK